MNQLELPTRPQTATARGISEPIATPWHEFGPGGGAWMLHPADLRALDPFVLVDHFQLGQPVFAPHPHAGFSAVSYLFEDSADGLLNRTSLGEKNFIAPGSLQWFQAGRGAMHDEAPRTPGRAAHGLQVFVNSAAANKNAEPASFSRDAAEIAVVEREGARVRVVLGEFAGHSVRFGAHTPVTLLDITLSANATLEVPLPRAFSAFAIVARGALAGHRVDGPHALRFDAAGDVVRLAAGPEGVQLVLLAGAPIGEPLAARGPFIGNGPTEVNDMIRRFQRGEMGELAPIHPATS
ncbi:pirin family protein [Rivibacter subsaxonicus]|uniref:Redox-sensitive bicupin YhaK (Pirin superfamily) n=1 Tax=Rivibacter subsaxonicus TaxID=457575 RepID=A0A4Q7W0B5_9BURK|nr:pirin-like C-terminal cupin domain-containing protein [Rivibacter subsaxonicus]RZU02597.1 hypothetical protein EV670_0625 [Rivibacter subsaxonicus]